MAAGCVIVVERLEDGSFRATCPVFPDLVAAAATEEEAREALVDKIGRRLQDRNLAV
jgi:predicted RNase H-like HicB family nuclease